MATPDFIEGNGNYWENIDDDTGSYASGEFTDSEPRVKIPEVLDEHKTAIALSAIGMLGVSIAGVAVAKHVKRRKTQE